MRSTRPRTATWPPPACGSLSARRAPPTASASSATWTTRLDPEQATRAAARHLRDLYDRFGDWQLALAGYNCNPAVIARAAARFEERTGRRATFWDIEGAIPRETRAYVPMFIATTLVVSNPDAYNLPSYEPGAAYTFDRVPVEGGTRLSEVARAISVDEAVLRALNPSLRAGRVPSSRSSHQLRIPVGHVAEHAAALSRFAPGAAGVQMAAETVRFGPRAVRPVAPQERGEALVAMASRERTRTTTRPRRSTDAPVARAAPVREYSPTVSVQTLAFEARAAVAEEAPVAEAPAFVARTAPTPEPVLVAEAAPVTEPAEEATPEADEAPAPAARPAPAREAATPVRTVSARATTHRVARGETLSAIARQHGVTVAQLREWNGVEGDVLYAGRTLRLTADASARGRRAAARAAVPAAAPTSHSVARGENLTTIARRYGTTVGELQRLNNLRDGTIRAGQSLRLPPRRGARG